MFTKESLYINAVKYDTQLKLDYKKITNEEISKLDNSTFLTSADILPPDIALKLNSLQEETDDTFISTLLISDTTKLVPKALSSKLTDCEVAKLNNEFDIAVLKTTLFETKNYFVKTGIDYIYSAFHIMNLHLEKNVCRNEMLLFLFNNKAFIFILDDKSLIVYNKTVDLPSFESVKKTHFYEDDAQGQKLFDELYYLELNEIIHNILNSFYEKKNDTFIEKITILYVVKQLSMEQIERLNEELLLKIDYHAINIDEEIFELSRDKHLKKSFTKPRKKKKKTNFIYLYVIGFLLLSFLGVYKLYTSIETKNNIVVENKIIDTQEENKVKKNIVLPDHINLNDKIEQKIKTIFNSIAYDIVLNELKINLDYLELKGNFLKSDTYITSLKPFLDNLYEYSEYSFLPNDKNVNIESKVIAKNEIDSKIGTSYKTNTKEYIIDEFIPVDRVTEQLKILLPQTSIIKYISTLDEDIIKFNYKINILVKEPKEFFELINLLNSELYSINIAYPINMVKIEAGIEIEFNLTFNQIK